MAVVVTDAQRADPNPVMKEWVAAKDKENAAASGVAPLVGPIMPGTARPNVPVAPVSAAASNTPAPIQNGVLPGPYKQPDGSYQAGANVVNGQIQYNQPQQTAQPVSANQASAYKPPDYAALAAARTAAALAQKKTIAEQQKASLDRSYARSNEITQDNRTLENGQINRTLNPFSGKTAYDKGIIGRERTLADETSAGNLQAQKSNIDQLLADYENATADEQVRIADELERADRDYQLNLATFNQNQSNWDKTYNQNQQQIDYSQNPNNPSNQGQVLQNQGQAQQNILNQYKIDGYPAEQQAAAEQIQQQLKAGKLSNDAAEFNLKQLKDPNSTYNQAAKMDLEMKKIDYNKYPEKSRLELQQLQNQIAEIGKVHTTPQTQMEKDMDQVKLDTARKQLDLLNNPEGKPQKATDYKTNPDFASDVAYIKSNPASADMLETNAQDFINRYGYDGYNALRQAAGLD